MGLILKVGFEVLTRRKNSELVRWKLELDLGEDNKNEGRTIQLVCEMGRGTSIS